MATMTLLFVSFSPPPPSRHTFASCMLRFSSVCVFVSVNAQISTAARVSNKWTRDMVHMSSCSQLFIKFVQSMCEEREKHANTQTHSTWNERNGNNFSTAKQSMQHLRVMRYGCNDSYFVIITGFMSRTRFTGRHCFFFILLLSSVFSLIAVDISSLRNDG